MDSRRARLKELAARSARLWGLMPLPEVLSGETRIETRNAVYRLRDGICYSVQRHDPHAAQARLDPSAFVGMRVVGWLWQDDPRSVLSLDWQPGAYAVLWRRGTGGGDRSAVALTSPTVAFRQAPRSAPVRSEPARRPSGPPPLPALPPAIQRALARPPTPPSLPVPAPPSTTRLHTSSIPAPPETPTPLVRRSSGPPPLPSRARAATAPRPYRVPAILS
jgi:hypothetical protein